MNHHREHEEYEVERVDPSGKQFTTQLDQRGRIAQIDETTTITSKTLTGYLYDPVGRQNGFTLFDDNTPLLTGSLSFNNRGWEDERVYQTISGPELYRADGVLYDPNGNLTDEAISGSVVQTSHVGSRDYVNDPLNRLTDQTTPAVDLDWTYDLVGNWTGTNQNGAPETRGVNDENEYVSVNFSSSWTDYDDRGNLIEWGLQDYIYDWANRLIEVRDSGTTVARYTYDAANRRVSKHVLATGVTTTYAYKSSQVFEEYENGSLARSFVYGEYIDAPIALYDAATGETYYYLRDRRANIIALIDDSGAVVESYEYTAFGTQTIYDSSGLTLQSSLLNNPYGFTGRRYDEETGLWYYRNRMYSDVIGRFLQRDPPGFVDGYNLYAYVRNNPMRWVDPLGLNAILYQSMNPGISAEMGESGVRTAQIVTESIVNSAPYQNTSLMVDYIARDDTSFITDSRLVMGIGFSYLSGDIFDSQPPVNFGSNTISVNGIKTDFYGGRIIANDVNNAFGVSNTNAVVNNSHWLFGIGDFIQIAGEELGAITIPSVQAAEIARTMGSGEFDWIAHSQGTSVSRGAFTLLPYEITSRINFQGFGGQSYIDAADYGLNSSRNAYMPGDFVPSLSPRNWSARFFGSGGYEALPSNGTARDLFGFIPTTISPHLWSEPGGYNAYINGPNNPSGGINTGVNNFGYSSSFAPLLYEPTTPTFIWDNPTSAWEMNPYSPNGLFDTVSPDPFDTFNPFDTFDPGFGNPFGPSIIDPWNYSPFDGSNISDPFGSSRFDTGFSDPFGYDPFGFLNGGQSAPFIDRSRLIHRNSRAVHGRSTFTNRADVPRPTSLSIRLFK